MVGMADTTLADTAIHTENDLHDWLESVGLDIDDPEAKAAWHDRTGATRLLERVTFSDGHHTDVLLYWHDDAGTFVTANVANLLDEHDDEAE